MVHFHLLGLVVVALTIQTRSALAQSFDDQCRSAADDQTSIRTVTGHMTNCARIFKDLGRKKALEVGRYLDSCLCGNEKWWDVYDVCLKHVKDPKWQDGLANDRTARCKQCKNSRVGAIECQS